MQEDRSYDYFDRQIARSENYELGPVTLSAIRHDLIDAAIKLQDDDLWLDLGRALVRACDMKDLTTKVSDRFVDNCPDVVFETLGRTVSPYFRFAGWRKRTERALRTGTR
jgi:hypothetical protein